MEIPYTVEHRPDTGIYNAKLGIWLFLASEVMLFGGLFSAYILLRVGADEGMWPHGWLNVTLGTVNTLLLALSAITTLLAWAAFKFGMARMKPKMTKNPTTDEINSATMMARGTDRFGLSASSARSAAPS